MRAIEPLTVRLAVPRELRAAAEHSAPAEIQVRVWPSADPAAARRPVLVALHGWADSGEVFGPLANALRHRWTVIAPDAPGHGGTEWPPAPAYSVPDQAAGVLALLDALPSLAGRRSSVVLLGHSMGAVAAARAAAERPETVAALLLEEPVRTTPRRTPSVAAAQGWLAHLRGLDDDARTADLRRAHPDWPADEHEPWLRSKAQADPALTRVPVDWGPSLIVWLAETRCPVAIVRGQQARGGIVSPPAARRCAAACRGGAEVLSLDAGHSPRREARVPYLTAVAGMLGAASG